MKLYEMTVTRRIKPFFFFFFFGFSVCAHGPAFPHFQRRTVEDEINESDGMQLYIGYLIDYTSIITLPCSCNDSPSRTNTGSLTLRE